MARNGLARAERNRGAKVVTGHYRQQFSQDRSRIAVEKATESYQQICWATWSKPKTHRAGGSRTSRTTALLYHCQSSVLSSKTMTSAIRKAATAKYVYASVSNFEDLSIPVAFKGYRSKRVFQHGRLVIRFPDFLYPKPVCYPACAA